MRQPKPFKYKLSPRPPQQPLNRLEVSGEGERLTGFVHGKEASDLEERFANALDKLHYSYMFEYEVLSNIGVPGEENQIDFIVFHEGTWPIEVDGMWVHHSSAQKAKDKLRDALLDEALSKDGWEQIRRVPGSDLESQDDADTVVREIFA
jgi:hypothetical protein